MLSIIIFFVGIFIAIWIFSKTSFENFISEMERRDEIMRGAQKYAQFIPKEYEKNRIIREVLKLYKTEEGMEKVIKDFKYELTYVFGKDFRKHMDKTDLYHNLFRTTIFFFSFIKYHKIVYDPELLMAGFNSYYKIGGTIAPLYNFKAIEMMGKLLTEAGAKDVCFIPIKTQSFRDSISFMRDYSKKNYNPNLLPPHQSCGIVNLGVTRFEGGLDEALESQHFREKYEVKDFEKWIRYIQEELEKVERWKFF